MKRAIIAALALGLLFLVGCGAEEKAAGLPEMETATYAEIVGTIGLDYIENTYPEANILPFDSLNDAVTSLLSGKADYFLTSYTNSLGYLRAYPDRLTILYDDIIIEHCFITINKDETQLTEDISRVVERFLADGTLERLGENWIHPDGSSYVQDEIPYHEDGEVLRVAVSAEREPMCFVMDGEIVGLDPELIQRIAYELGMRVEFYDMKFSALIPSVTSGKTPVAISNMSATEERRKSVNFSPPYFQNNQVLLTRSELLPAAPAYTELDQLAGKRIGSLTGGIFDQYALARWPDAEILYYDRLSDQIVALQANKVDAFLNDEPVARQVCLNTAGLTYISEALSEDYYGFAFPQTAAGELMRDQFNTFLKTAEDGRLPEILDEIWFGDDESLKVVEGLDEFPAVNGVLHIAASLESPPFNYSKDGQPAGYEVDLLTRFCREYGYGLEFHTTDFASMMPGLVSGHYDVAAGCICITEERAKSVHFSDPIYAGGVVAMVLDKQAVVEQSFWEKLRASFVSTFIVEQRWKMIVEGIGITLLISICAGILGLLLGFGVCLLRMGRKKAVTRSTAAVIRAIQGTPVVVLLMILYYVVFSKSGLDGVTVAILAFGLNFAVYTAEILRSGIEAVDRGQREAAAALGFSPPQTFAKIVFPQAARHFLPVLKGEYISLVKMTSVVGYVAVQDLTKMSDIIRARTFEAFFPLVTIAIIYIILSIGLTSLLHLVEIRVDPKQRPRVLKGVKVHD